MRRPFARPWAKFMRVVEAAARSVARLVARKVARNRQVAEVLFDRCRTPSDLVRSGLNHLAFLLRLPKIPFLTSVMLETTNHCNLRCRFCPSAKMHRPRGFMDPGLAERVLRDCGRLQYVYLYDWGEPMLHPELPSIIQTASRLGHRTFMVTNGTLLTPSLSEAIIRAGLSAICFSIDGLFEIYSSLRGFDYRVLEQRVMEFLGTRERLNPRLRVEINYVVSRETEQQVERFRSIWAARVDHITFQPMLMYSKVRRFRPCRELWKGSLVVLWNGTVVACCVDYDGVLKVGDATEESITSILNSRPMVLLRSDHVRGRFCSLCSYCSEYETECVDGRFDGRISGQEGAPLS